MRARPRARGARRDASTILRADSCGVTHGAVSVRDAKLEAPVFVQSDDSDARPERIRRRSPLVSVEADARRLMCRRRHGARCDGAAIYPSADAAQQRRDRSSSGSLVLLLSWMVLRD